MCASVQPGVAKRGVGGRRALLRSVRRVAGAAAAGVWVAAVGVEAADTVMNRAGSNPVFRADPGSVYYTTHIANAAMLPPDRRVPNLWRVYIRGSAHYPSGAAGEVRFHDAIGLFVQHVAAFAPDGPWMEFGRLPLLRPGSPGSCDERHLLDCAPVVGPDGRVILYYTAVNNSNHKHLAGAVSDDGGFTFRKFDANPLMSHVGSNDAVVHDGRYYVFYGDSRFDPRTGKVADNLKIYAAVTDRPDRLRDAPKHLAIDVGPPGTFDSHSVNGGRVFHLLGRWYMVYQCSARRFDYPDRFHVAWSDDLLRWRKIDHSTPFFLRGPAGAWDEGAIWFGDVVEHEGRLWMLYEGWGGGPGTVDRDRPYYPGGRSQTGLASVPVGRFLEWCGHAETVKGKSHE